MTSSASVFISRLRGLPVVNDSGDRIGKIRDVVVQSRTEGKNPRVRGLVVEIFARQRIFIPMARVASIDAVQTAITGVINTRRFDRRQAETLVVEDLFDKQVRKRNSSEIYTILDVSMREFRYREWELDELALQDTNRRGFGRRPHVEIVDWTSVDQSQDGRQGTDQIVAEMDDMHAADVARELHELDPSRRLEVVNALDDNKLADVMEELPEDEQVELLSQLDTERAADILEQMDPDAAADLVGELPPQLAEQLLSRMEPDEAKGVRQLLSYAEETAGGLMTPEPVILPSDATVADALAVVRNEELTTALACMVHICRSPYETPTGRYLGPVHIQRLLREPPSTLISTLIDDDLEPLRVDDHLERVSRYFATYDLVNAPVVDDQGRLVGAVTVDDVIDHMLPDDWRSADLDRDSTDTPQQANIEQART